MKSSGLLLFLGILPIILILTIIYNHDKNKEPIKLLLFLFGCGILGCFVVLKVSDLLKYVFPFMNMSTYEMDLASLIAYSFIGIALVEELSKWIAVYFFGYRNREFEELYDGIVYAVFVSLGFAFFENLFYVFTIGNVKTAILRALLAVPGHACDAIFMGYYLGMAKQFQYRKRKDLERNNILLSILVPTLLHGIYDFCLLIKFRPAIVVFTIFIVVLYIVSIKKLKEVSNMKGKIKIESKFCKKCGGKVENSFCTKCGARQ